MLIGGRPVGDGPDVEVRNPFDGSVVGTVPEATEEEVELALSVATEGASVVGRLPRVERAAVLARAAELIESSGEQLTRTIASESGKTVREAEGEVGRAVQTFRVASEEARRLAGEVVPFDGAPTGRDRFGFYLRVPLGVIVAITPFNFPLNLAAHKVAPAIAAGNSVILKPASACPLTGIALGEILYEAGLPPAGLSVVTGSGGGVGSRLVGDPRPRMVTFTGSPSVGRAIVASAGLKKTAMELGSNSAVIVTERCDVEAAAQRSARAAFALAGQVCISVQRVIVERGVMERFLEAACAVARSLVVGDQLSAGTDVGPMIEEGEAARAESWVAEARDAGASVLAGGARAGTLFEPTVLVDVPGAARIWRDEAFAPVMAVRPFDTLDEAIATVNDSAYGLQAGIYTDRLEDALRAAHEIECGGVMVNDVPTFRVDLMPYGGQKDSGLGREGPRFAVEEMTEIRVVSFRRPAA
ncbi:MAG: aldehyde dehydrogenase family protein [Candidatus Eisenbacteria bacterium]